MENGMEAGMQNLHTYLNYYRYALIWSDDVSILRIPGQYVEGSYSSFNNLVHVHSILHTDVQQVITEYIEHMITSYTPTHHTG